MALPRFLVDHLDEHGIAQLSGSETHHGAKVLRLSGGDPCILFDGRGYQAQGTVGSLDKRSLWVEYSKREFAPRDHDGRLHFAIALPKGDRQRNVIEKLVELGVDRLTPIDTQRSVLKLDSDALERLQRYSIEACKQSHRNRLMQIDPACSWKHWLQQMQSGSNPCSWVLHPAKSLATIDAEHQADQTTSGPKEFLCSQSTQSPLVLAIGPEGGFTSTEIQQAIQCGWRILDLGDRILRVETAVSVAATLGSLKLSQNGSDTPVAQSNPS
jgi:16S rRNA (uracil1498-N3)-methyltransferase